MKPSILKVYQKENAVAERPNVIIASEQSPDRFDIPLNLLELAEQGKPVNLINRSTVRPMRSNNTRNSKFWFHKITTSLNFQRKSSSS